MTDAELIESLRALEAAATPGEWERAGRSWAIAAMVPDASPDPVCIIDASSGEDAALIAAMRNALPRLLDLADGKQHAAGLAQLRLEKIQEDQVTIRDLTAERDELAKRVAGLQTERALFLELIACTNRDGGHYHAAHGTVQAVKLGQENFYAVTGERDELAKRVASLEELNQEDWADRLSAEAQRDRYLAALKAEACREGRCYRDTSVGNIAFRVTRAADGTLEAVEVSDES